MLLGICVSSPALGNDWQCVDEEIDGSLLRRCSPTMTAPGNVTPAPAKIAPKLLTQPSATDNPPDPAGKNAEPDDSAAAGKTLDESFNGSACNQPNTELEDQQGHPPAQSEFGELPIYSTANEASLEKGVAHFSGEVHFSSGDIDLHADRADYFVDSQEVKLEGNIIVANPTGSISGNAASINLESGSQEIIAAKYMIRKGNVRGKADRITVDSNDVARIENGSYTRCTPENKVWEVRASDITLNPNRGQGRAKHARLKFYGTPVFYLPYAQFPIGDQRQSGFLFPKFSDTESGADISLPYYLNLAPNFDATVSARYKAKHGYLTEAETRWLNRFDRWTVGGSYIDGDESQNDEDRWLINAEERGSLGDHIRTSIDYTKVSDSEFLRDLNTTSLSINRASQLSQTFNVSYQSLDWYAGSSVQLYQSIDPSLEPEESPYEQLPTVWLNYQPAAKPFRITPAAELRYSQFENDVLVEGDRSYGHVSLAYPLPLHALRLNPSIGYQYQHYNLDNNTTMLSDEELGVGSTYGRFEINTRFENNSPETYKSLEPSLTYLYREITDGRQDASELSIFDSSTNSFDHYQLDALSQFVGYDVVEETNQLAFTISQHRHSRKTASNTSITLGQILYFQTPDPTSLTATVAGNEKRRSNIVGQFRHSRQHWQGVTSVQWDSEENLVQQAYAGIRFRSGKAYLGGNHSNGARQIHPEKRNIINIGYNFRRANRDFSLLAENIEQADISMVGYLNPQWGIFGKYQYDLENQRVTESLGGIEYDSCCVQLRLVFRDAIIYDPLNPQLDDRDQNILLQIEFKGLIGVGRSLENALSESIHGYQNNF